MNFFSQLAFTTRYTLKECVDEPTQAAIVSHGRPFAASHSRGTKPSCERVKVALGQDKQGKLPFTCKIMYVFCSSCPSAFALRRGDFVPRQWQDAKGLKDLAGSSPRILANEGPGHGPRPDV